MGFDYATLGFSCCITPESCLSVNDGQNQTGQYELYEAIDNDDKADILALALVSVSALGICQSLNKGPYDCPLQAA